MIKFFQPEEEERIIEAIRRAEAHTSGEVRVHLEVKPKRPAAEEAVRVFRKLGMDKTKARNGVLILIAPERREFAIIGDQGIDEVVPTGFWDSTRDLMQEQFRHGDFCEGLVRAIDNVGSQLHTYFPYEEDDENELPDDISYGNVD